MTPLVYSNEALFCILTSAYLLAALVGTVCFAMSVSYKLKLQYVLPEVAFSTISAVLFCYYADGISIRYFGANPVDFDGSPCFMPIWSVASIAVLLFAAVIVCLIFVVRKRMSSLTAMSVKDALAVLASGLCFYDETGRVLLLNEQIDDECKEIIGESLYDGKTFWEKLTSGNVSFGNSVTQSEGSVIVERTSGKATCYKRIPHDFDGKTVYELSGTDITKELALKKEIERKNDNLHKMNERLREYGETVEEVTKERETLAARVKVHGNLGSLILRTKKALVQGEYDRGALISEWNDVMSLIFASDDTEDRFSEADRTAASVGVKIVYDGKLPEKGTSAETIFANAVFECVVNTARHADGTELYVKTTEDEKSYRISLSDNGKRPTNEIKEGGGLSTLRTMAENAGGQMTTSAAPEFSITITIPKEARTNER